MYGGVVLVYVGPHPLSWVCISWKGGIQHGPDSISTQPMCRVSGGISGGSSVVGGWYLPQGWWRQVASCGVETMTGGGLYVIVACKVLPWLF